MAVTGHLYDYFATAMLNKEIDWSADTIKFCLLTSAYTPDRAAHAHYSDLTNEVVGTGYTAGGITATSKTELIVANVLVLDLYNLSWPTSTFAARYAVMYDWTGTASTSPLICYQDAGQDMSAAGGAFGVEFDAGGLITGTLG